MKNIPQSIFITSELLETCLSLELMSSNPMILVTTPNSNPFLLTPFIPPGDSLDQSLELGAGLDSKHRLHLRSISFPLK